MHPATSSSSTFRPDVHAGSGAGLVQNAGTLGPGCQPPIARRGQRRDAGPRRHDGDCRCKGGTHGIQSSTGNADSRLAEEVENLPLADRNFATLASLAPGVTGTSGVGGGGATNFMMDGVGRWIPGATGCSSPSTSNRSRSQSADLGLSGGIRPVERPADHGRDQERHESLPRVGVRRRAQVGLEREQQGQTSSTAIRSR